MDAAWQVVKVMNDFYQASFFSCFLVNITKPDVIIHLAVLLVNHLLIHKPVKQYITHWIICEDFLAQLPALNSVFQGIPITSELPTLFLDQSSFLAVDTAVGLWAAPHVLPDESHTPFLCRKRTDNCTSFGISFSWQKICQVSILQLFWGYLHLCENLLFQLEDI